MEKKTKNTPMEKEIFYSMNIEDIQTVAEEVLSRKLNRKEVECIRDSFVKHVNWFDAIETAILEEGLE